MSAALTHHDPFVGFPHTGKLFLFFHRHRMDFGIAAAVIPSMLAPPSLLDAAMCVQGSPPERGIRWRVLELNDWKCLTMQSCLEKSFIGIDVSKPRQKGLIH